jgi:ACS family glucarate transporter-like MFS transporter
LMTWMPTFFSDQGVSLTARGWITFVVFLCAVPGLLLGGLWTDWMTTRFGKRWGRALPMGLTRLIAAAACLACLTTKDTWLITAALCLVSLANDLGLPAIWAYSLDVGGRYAGAVLGWGNMIGNIGAFVGPNIVSPFVAVKDWDAVFLICAVAFIISGLAGFFIDARQVILKKAPSQPTGTV